MNTIWRCIQCHRTWTEKQLNVTEGVKTCCDPKCGGMVCDVTHSKIGEEFIEKQSHVPSEVHYAFMNKQMHTNYESEQS